MIDFNFKVKLPSLPPMPPMPNLGRYILITFLVVSLIMSGTSMYVSLAAPQRAIFARVFCEQLLL